MRPPFASAPLKGAASLRGLLGCLSALNRAIRGRVDALRPVINIARLRVGARPLKFARVVFPEGFTMVDVRATLERFPESEGFRCDLRQVGPQGFSIPLPLDMAGLTPAVGGAA